MHIQELRKILLFCIISCVAFVSSVKRQNCSDSIEAAEFQNQYLFNDDCTSVCVQTCGNNDPASCLETVALDGTCGTYATCGSTGCECDPFADITAIVNSANFATTVETYVECSAQHAKFRFSKCPANAYGLYLDNMFMDGLMPSDGMMLVTDAHNTCKGRVAYHSNSLLYEFTVTHFNACNTAIENTADKIIWKNAVIGRQAAPIGNISRSRSMRLNFTCAFAKQLVKSLSGALSPMIGVYEGATMFGNGAFTITIGLWSDSTYSTPFSDGDSVDVLDRVYVGISSSAFVVGEHFVIIASHVTPSPDRYNSTRFDSITDSCPVDSFTTITKTGIDNEIHYNFAAFLFSSLPAAGQSLWVHATVEWCTPSATCPKSCPSRRRRSTTEQDDSTQKFVSVGPIALNYRAVDPPASAPEKSQPRDKDFAEAKRTMKQFIDDEPAILKWIPVCFGMICLVAGIATTLGLLCMYCCYFDNIVSKIKTIHFPKKKRELVV